MRGTSGIGSFLLSATATLSHILPESVRLSVYRFAALAGLIRRILNRAAPEGLTEVTVAAGALQGARLLLDIKSEKYYWLGNYEPMLQKAIVDFVKPGMVIYELGANIGYITLIFARAVGATGKVFAFEPLPSNIKRLRSNINLNNANHIVHLVPKAVSNDGKNAKFLVHSSTGMGKLKGIHGRDVPYVREVDVFTVCLDDFVYQDLNPSPNIVKMDIEGGGEKAIFGMERILSEVRPICFWELHGPEEGHIARSALRRQGYSIRRMASGYPEIEDESELGWKEYIVALP